MQEENRLFNRVNAIIEKDIRPFIESDGGLIELVSVEDDGTVFVKLAGACAGCPGATMTLKGGVQQILKMKIPQVNSVELAF